jgi:hypothetical protein
MRLGSIFYSHGSQLIAGPVIVAHIFPFYFSVGTREQTILDTIRYFFILDCGAWDAPYPANKNHIIAINDSISGIIRKSRVILQRPY